MATIVNIMNLSEERLTVEVWKT